MLAALVSFVLLFRSSANEISAFLTTHFKY